MDKKISSLIFLSVFSSIIVAVSSQKCDGSGNVKYAINRKAILSSLPANVKMPKGFYNGSTDDGPESSDRVYAMAMCIDGSGPEVCSECLKVATDLLIHNCHNKSEGFIWFPYKTLCFARFSNRSFFGGYDTHLLYSEGNSVLSELGPTEFDDNFSNLTTGLISRGKKVATNTEALTEFQTLHALMLCTPDLSSSNCSACLQETVVVYHKVEGLTQRQGGVIAYPSCFFRWELYPFSGGFNLSKSSNYKKIKVEKHILQELPKTYHFVILIFETADSING